MSPEFPSPKRKLPILKLVIGAVGLIVIAALLLRGVKIGPLLDHAVEMVRDAGPVAFFGAMAILPAAGAPLSVFSLAAGEAFAPQMTMTGVVIAALVAIALNIALTYWLARYALRPVLTRLVTRYGYQVPRVTKDNALMVSIVVRNTGAPFFVQGYLLGLGEVPFRLYMLVSWLSVLPWTVAFIVLGKAAREGNFGKIGMVIVALIAAVVIFQLLRRRFTKRES